MAAPRSPRPAASRHRAGPDPVRVERAAREFLAALGVIEDPRMLAASARRIGVAWSGELLAGYREDPVRLLAPIPAGGHHGLVLARDLEFTSFCIHHLLPFSGVAHVAYLPAARLTGLSRLARMVDALARRLQIQEAMTSGIVAAIDRALRPRGAGAVVEAEHLCMTARGVRRRGHQVVTTAWSGVLLRRERERRAVLELLRQRG